LLLLIPLLLLGPGKLDASSEHGSTPVIFSRGDVNGDGFLSQADIVSLITYFQVGRLPPCADAADYDDSGYLDITDIINLFRFFYQNGDFPEEPFKTPGEDPTEDGLDCASAFQNGIMKAWAKINGSKGSSLDDDIDIDDGQVLDFIEFYNRRVYAYPGQRGVRIPILLSNNGEADGFTVSVRATEPRKIWLERIDLPGTFPGHVMPELYPQYDARLMEGYLARSFFMDFTLPFEGHKIPRGRRATVAYLVFSLSPEVSEGEQYWIHFADIPAQHDFRPAPMNEICSEEWSIQPALDAEGLEITISAESKLFIRGDVNHNHLLNITDVILILRYLFSTEVLKCLDPADVDDTGMIDLSDVIALAEYLFDTGIPPAVPFPNPGQDPTADFLGDCE